MNISIDTLVRTGVLIFALINQMLTIFGINPLPFSEKEVYMGLTNLLTIIAALWTWWKNNSFTQEAMKADEYMRELKTRK